jgi:hypothetical protein
MSFTADISRFIGKAEKSAEQAVRRISLDLLSRVILKSPVDTGRFRANWYASINYASNAVSNSVDKSGADSIRRGGSSINSYKLGDAAIYLTNNLPYAYRLETGYSKQAPSGMARLSVMEIASKYK